MNIAFIVVSIGFCILFFLYCINIVIPDITDDGIMDGSTFAQIEDA